VSPDLLRRQVTLIGSWTFSAMGMHECAEFIASKRNPARAHLQRPLAARAGREAYRKFDTQTDRQGVFLL